MRTEDSRIIFIIPTGYFHSTEERRIAWESMQGLIEIEYLVGRWNYYTPLGNRKKKANDSVFVLRRETNPEKLQANKWDWKVDHKPSEL